MDEEGGRVAAGRVAALPGCGRLPTDRAGDGGGGAATLAIAARSGFDELCGGV